MFMPILPLDTAITFTTENLMPALRIMGFGMLGIFVVIGVIILVLKLMTKIFPPKE
ncbi:MAG: hypothetical protein IJY82_02380 [Oscillospiraceae bacterium]|nr:hypothetical protein [Oscillospiraceae bacterium]